MSKYKRLTELYNEMKNIDPKTIDIESVSVPFLYDDGNGMKKAESEDLLKFMNWAIKQKVEAGIVLIFNDMMDRLEAELLGEATQINSMSQQEADKAQAIKDELSA